MNLKFIILLSFLLLNCKRKNALTIYPTYLSPLIIEDNLNIKKGPTKNSRQGYEETKSTVRKYRYLISTDSTNQYYSYWLYALSLDLDRIDERDLSSLEIKNLLKLDSEKPFPKDIKRINTLLELQELPRAILLKNIAQSGDSLKFLNGLNYKFQNHASFFNIAKGWMFLKNYNMMANYLKKAIDPTNYKRLHKRFSTTAGAVTLAFATEKYELIDTLSHWLDETDSLSDKYYRTDKNGNPDIYSSNQILSSKAIISKFKILSNENKRFRMSSLKDGTYTGSCKGFIDTITVKAEILNSKLNTLIVQSSKEDRPYSAHKIIPKRIIESKSIMIDAVTSATITSSAIIAATTEALYKAQ